VQTPPPRSSPVHQTQVIALARWLLILLFVVIGWVVLGYLAHVLAPILAALGIAYLLNPIVEGLERRKVRRSVGSAFVLVAFLTVIVTTLVIAIPAVAGQLSEFIRDLPRFVDNLITDAERTFNIEIPHDWKRWVQSEEGRQTLGDASGPLRQIATTALGGLLSLLGVLAEFLLVPVFAFYFLADWANVWRRLDHVIPPRRRANVRELMRQIDGVISNWVRGQAIVTSILAVLYAIGFSIVGMPLSVPIGLVVGALTVIPFVGTFVGAVIAALVTLGAGGSVQTLAMVGVVIVVLHLLEAAVLTPKIVGHRVGLSEAAALLAVVAGGKLLGFVGVVLAVPIAATVAVLIRAGVRYYERTAFFGHESDADVVVTPAMALIMPGRAWSWAEQGLEPAPADAIELAASEATGTADDWQFDTELGPSGSPSSSDPA
jgi:predicted PurR-regulated permease PerM